MKRPRLDKDVRSLSEFRAKVASFVSQVRETHRPLVITHRGNGAAVLLDVADYEALLDELELIRDVRDAERQIDAGEAVGHEAARRRLVKRLGE